MSDLPDPDSEADTLPEIPLPIVKICGCGCHHTQQTWETLPFVGNYVDEVATLEMRNCFCGSTIAVERLAP